MEGSPLLPGYKFVDSTLQDYRLVHKLDFRNGCRVIRDSNRGRLIDIAFDPYQDVDFVQYDPTLTYGRVRNYPCRPFIPHYALFAQKCLRFEAFFRQGVFDSPNEHYRIRHVNIIYFLEDDTLCVSEPIVDNAGFQQGKLVRRDKIPKNVAGDFLHWKDFNVGKDVCIYGVVYHIVNCDPFTREFLRSQGIDVGEKENPPIDPYTQLRQMKDKLPTRVTPIPDDSRRRFLEYDKMVLTFDATWNDDLYQIMYFLTDDTIAVREIHKPNDGKDPVAMLLKRTKVPKNWKDLPPFYPSIYMEYGDPEVTEYYTPKDFRVGETIFIFGRRFLLHDCNCFTRKYYSEMLGIVQPERIPLPTEKKEPQREFVPPPHIKFGSPEDTYASCLSVIPKVPKKNVMRQLLNFPKKLRYSMQMDAVHPEDKDRDFILEYNLSDGTIMIQEIAKRNSGRSEGTFLASMLVPKPGSSRDDPRYYTPEDFFIGARINIFNHHFVINGADLFVYRYIESNPEKFPRNLRDNMRNYFVQQGLLQDDIAAHVQEIEQTEFARESSTKNDEDKFKDEFNISSCIRDYEADAQRKYEDENDKPTFEPPSDEKCLTSTAGNEPESVVRHSSPESTENKITSTAKELKWADQIDHDHAGHPIVSCNPEHPICKTKKPECTAPSYLTKRDPRPEVLQLMYDNASH